MYGVPDIFRKIHNTSIRAKGKVYEVSFLVSEKDSFYHESSPTKSNYDTPIEIPMLITEMTPKYIEKRIGWVLEETDEQPVPIGIAPIYLGDKFLPWRENVKVKVHLSTPSTDTESSERVYIVKKVRQTSEAVTVFLHLVPYYGDVDYDNDFETVEDTNTDDFYLE